MATDECYADQHAPVIYTRIAMVLRKEGLQLKSTNLLWPGRATAGVARAERNHPAASQGCAAN